MFRFGCVFFFYVGLAVTSDSSLGGSDFFGLWDFVHWVTRRSRMQPQEGGRVRGDDQ